MPYVNIHGERFEVTEFKIWPFWERIVDFEPQTFDVLDRYLASDKDFLDIGAWIGPLALYASRRSRHVFAVEPDRVARQHLEANIELNGIHNITVLPFAVAAVEGCYWFGTTTDLGDSMSSLRNPEDDGARYEVLARTLPQIATLSRDWSIIKIDTEGGEAAIIPASEEFIREAGVPVWLSTHAPLLAEDDRTRLRESLQRLGVSLHDDFTEVLIAP